MDDHDDIDGLSPSKVIVEVHRQLLTGFQPATKAVAEAGTSLLRAFQNFQKNCDAYIKALENLARSGEKAFGEGKRKAAELEMVVNTMKSINDKHRENVEKFSRLVSKTNDYSREEKEKLKELTYIYENKEKAIKKAVNKGQQDKNDLNKFYNLEMEQVLQQQSQRYKFAADNHSEWLKSYVELLQFVKALTGEHSDEKDRAKAAGQLIQKLNSSLDSVSKKSRTFKSQQ